MRRPTALAALTFATPLGLPGTAAFVLCHRRICSRGALTLNPEPLARRLAATPAEVLGASLAEGRSSAPKSTLANLGGYTSGATLTLQNVAVGIADNCLIANLNWNILPKERWAIVGTNGCGKSTLLKAITGTAPEFIMEGSVMAMAGVPA